MSRAMARCEPARKSKICLARSPPLCFCTARSGPGIPRENGTRISPIELLPETGAHMLVQTSFPFRLPMHTVRMGQITPASRVKCLMLHWHSPRPPMIVYLLPARLPISNIAPNHQTRHHPCQGAMPTGQSRRSSPVFLQDLQF